MFANLKNKLIEEVKSSKLQQFANAAQAAVSSSSVTPSNSDSTTSTNENFFSITEEDTPQNSPFKPLKLPVAARPPVQRSSTPQSLNGTGAIPRTRKLSNSSMASDISFRLPTYDSSAIYHMQSDFEMSGSEMDDSASQSKLDAITKEKLYDAYRKSLERYNKYRCRYTDLAKKYKELERDSSKARSVLVETQEKAIRRISELREQCTLEQQAKAHLEEALRMEMDDMNCKMQAYQTKLKLLGENPDNIIAALNETERKQANSDQLIDLDIPHETTNGSLTSNVGGDEELIGRIALLEKQLAEREKQLRQLQEKCDESNEKIKKLKLQEEENSLLLAQTKQAIHSELENKEKEVKKLNTNIKQLQNDLTAAQKKETQLNLLTEELSELKKKFKTIEASKQESDAKVIASEHIYAGMKEQLATKEKALSECEAKLDELRKSTHLELENVRKQNQELNETVQRFHQNEFSLVEVNSELSKTKDENATLNEILRGNAVTLENLEKELTTQRESNEHIQKELSDKAKELTEEKMKLLALQQQIEEERLQYETGKERLKQLEAELCLLNKQNENNESEMITKLKAELKKANEESSENMKSLMEQFANKEKESKATINKFNKLKKQYESLQEQISNQNAELETLKGRHFEEKATLELQLNEAKELGEQKELEKNELQNQITNILKEITHMEEQLRNVQKSHNDLEAEKHQLEIKIEQMQENTQEGTQQLLDDLTKTQEKLKQIEQKLQNVESENTQLLEKNCLLEESMQSLEKQIVEYERNKDGDEANASQMRMKLATAEDTIQKLNEKMFQILDENSRMQNAQELMEHDQRTQQDRCDALEKEKLLALDAQKCAENEKEQLVVQHANEMQKLNELIEKLQQNEISLTEEKTILVTTVKELEDERDQLNANCSNLTQRLGEIQALQANEGELKQLLQAKQEEFTALQNIKDALLEENANEIKKLNEQLSMLEEQNQAFEREKEELMLLRSEKDNLLKEVEIIRNNLEVKTQKTCEMEKDLEELNSLKQKFEHTTKELNFLKSERLELEAKLKNNESELLQKTKEIDELHLNYQENKSDEEKLAQLSSELMILREIESKLQSEFAVAKTNYEQQLIDLQDKYTQSQLDVERVHEANNSLEQQLENLKSKQESEISNLKSKLNQLEQEKVRLQEQVATDAEQLKRLTAFDEVKIENEYLNKLVKELENDLEKQKHDAVTNSLDSEELKVKFKSLQCELYVHKENAETFEKLVKAKELEFQSKQAELEKVASDLASEREELQRQAEHTKFITEQNDQIQKELLHMQQNFAELEHKFNDVNVALNELRTISETQTTDYQAKLNTMESDLADYQKTIAKLEQQIANSNLELKRKIELEAEIQALKVELAERENTVTAVASLNVDTGKPHPDGEQHLRQLNETLQRELEDLTRRTRLEIESLEHENDELKCNNQQMFERITKLETTCAELKDLKPLDGTTASDDKHNLSDDQSSVNEEKAALEMKLKTIMSEVQEVSNRNLFLEQKCENFLILEQSNERLKLQNAKLSRQLDETLVSMQHNEGVSANTEFEYLRNIMFQYLTGSANGNNETLVKVISAVLKFSPQQTQVALEKEHQRRSLINKIL